MQPMSDKKGKNAYYLKNFKISLDMKHDLMYN